MGETAKISPFHSVAFANICGGRVLPAKPDERLGWLLVIAVVSTVATLVELLLIDMQAFRGVGSHFNHTTAFNTLVYSQWNCSPSAGHTSFDSGAHFHPCTNNRNTHSGSKIWHCAWFNSGLHYDLTYCRLHVSCYSGHWVDAPATDHIGVPVLGWTKQGGDLRVPHFFATHLMQVLPLVGWFVDRKLLLSARQASGIIAVTLSGVSLTLFTLFQALAGIPLIG